MTLKTLPLIVLTTLSTVYAHANDNRYTLVARCTVTDCKAEKGEEEDCKAYNRVDVLKYTGGDHSRRFEGHLAMYLEEKDPAKTIEYGINFEPVELYSSPNQYRVHFPNQSNPLFDVIIPKGEKESSSIALSPRVDADKATVVMKLKCNSSVYQ